MRIGVISDTHGYFDPQIPGFFAGVEHILHGGDIGPLRIILELERIAPVTAVLGNTDADLPYSETEIVSVGGHKFFLQHIVEAPSPTETTRHRIRQTEPKVVVFGHSHKPFCQTLENILYLNPGYAGKQRFALPRSVAVLHLESAGFRVEFHKL